MVFIINPFKRAIKCIWEWVAHLVCYCGMQCLKENLISICFFLSRNRFCASVKMALASTLCIPKGTQVCCEQTSSIPRHGRVGRGREWSHLLKVNARKGSAHLAIRGQKQWQTKSSLNRVAVYYDCAAKWAEGQ